MKRKLRVALVGCGGMGVGHGRLVKALGEDLIAVADLNEQNRERAADRLGAKGYASTEAMLASEKFDAAVVATTNPSHADVTVACLEAGASVFCEKPMATTYADCKRMVAAQGDPLPFLQIGFELRTCPPFAEIGRIIASGEIGEVRHVHFLQTPGAKHRGNWHVTSLAGGLFCEKLCHQIDSFRMLLGADPEEVVAISARNVMGHYEVPDNMFATFKFPEGKVAHISFFVGRAAEVATHTNEEYLDRQHWLEYIIVGTKGSISMPLWKMELVVTHNDGGLVTFSRRIRLEGKDAEAPYHDTRPEMEMFLRAVREGRRSEFTADDSIRTMRAVFAAEKSAVEGGRPVRISEIK
jgi:predicted dehydrogenase